MDLPRCGCGYFTGPRPNIGLPAARYQQRVEHVRQPGR